MFNRGPISEQLKLVSGNIVNMILFDKIKINIIILIFSIIFIVCLLIHF